MVGEVDTPARPSAQAQVREGQGVSMWWPRAAWGRFVLLSLGAAFLIAAGLQGDWIQGTAVVCAWYLMLAALRWAVYRDPRYEVRAARVSPFYPATWPGWLFLVAWKSWNVYLFVLTESTEALPVLLAHYAMFVIFRAVYFKQRAV